MDGATSIVHGAVVGGADKIISKADESCPAETSVLIHDGYRLLLANFAAITLGALHISRSVLPFAPRNAQLTSTYAPYSSPCVKIVAGADKGWSACLMALTDPGHVNSVAFSHDGARLVSGSDDKSVRVWESINGGLVVEFKGHSSKVSSVAFVRDGNQVVSASWDKTVRIWDVPSGDVVIKLEGHQKEVSSISVSTDGHFIASGSFDKSVRIWNAVNGTCLMILDGHSDQVTSVAFSSDSSVLASGSLDHTVRMWDVANRCCVAMLEDHTQGVSCLTVSTDAARIASGGHDHTIRLRDIQGGRTMTLRGHRSVVTSVVFSPCGNLLVSGSRDSTLRVWDARSGHNVATWTAYMVIVASVAVSPDGRHIVSGGPGASVQIWDLAAAIQAATRVSHSPLRRIEAIAFSADGSRLAILYADMVVEIWDARNGQTITCLSLQGDVVRHTLYDYSVHFSLDGTQIVVRGEANDALPSFSRLFDASSGDRIFEPSCLCVDYRPDLEPVRYHKMRLWLRTPRTPALVCFLPPSLPATMMRSSALDGSGYSVAIGCTDGRIILLHVDL